MPDDAFDELLRHAESRVGRVLKDKWTLDQLLGVGGMASVYAATHRNQKRVAIKMLHPELSFNTAVRQRFLREGYVANSVQDAGAVSVFDDDVTDDGCVFLVMELLDGETLQARWERKNQRLPPGEVLALLDRVLDTLAAAHSHGIVHRDLKPENLFFTRNAEVKVLDFGIARVRELSGGSKTQTGSLMGTPLFMPPEQARGRWEEVDAQSDLWAIGATAFTLLSGEFVHVAGTLNEALVQAVTQPARSLGALRPELPDALVKFVDRSLSYDKQDRWRDAEEMQIGLREAYACLAADWDEQTILADAAAALPDTPLLMSPADTSTAAKVTSASKPPLPISALVPRVAIAAGVGLASFASLAAFVVSGKPAQTHIEGPQEIPAPRGPTPVTSVAIASAPAAPAIAIDQLPIEAPQRRAVSPTNSAKVTSAGDSPTTMRPAPIAPPVTDPFAGRE